jgi:hypothetical protein
VAIPDNGCFPLVGNPHGNDLAGLGSSGGDGFSDYFLCFLPDFQWILLDPTGTREDLPVFFLSTGDRAVMVEDHAARAGGPLID